MRELALFAGAGGGILGGKLLGWRTVCAVEKEPYAASVLAQRQNDGFLPPFPIWDDVCTFDGKPWSGVVDVVSGGFPCQDISAAGTGNGIEGERSGLWVEMARIIGEVRPHFVLVENSPMLTSRGLGAVLGDLASLGFDARWGVLGAADVRAPHQRDRIWIVANADSSWKLQPQGREQEQWRWLGNGSETLADTDEERRNWRAREQQQSRRGEPSNGCNDMADPNQARLQEWKIHGEGEARPAYPWKAFERDDWWATEPDVGRMAHGVAARVDRLKAIGNGQVPQCAAAAWRLLSI